MSVDYNLPPGLSSGLSGLCNAPWLCKGTPIVSFAIAQKLPAYGRAGVAEVWVVNLQNATFEEYREPLFTGYASKTVLHAGERAKPLAFPDAVVDVAELLKR